MIRSAALFVTVAAVLMLCAPTAAQDSIDVRESSARSDFPNGIVFTLRASANSAITDVRLVYEVAPDGVRVIATPNCVGQTLVNCSFDLPSDQRSRLIPGAELTFFWRLTVAAAVQETEPKLVIYEDDRFDWRRVSDGNITLWWYAGSEDEARTVLAAGRASLDEIGALLQTEVAFPVKIRYYGSAQDMQLAIISNNVGGVVTLGEVVYSDTAMVSADSAPAEIARHEIAHIVVRQAVPRPFQVPDWLNEGTAVFAQTQPLAGQRNALDAAIRSNTILSVRSLSSASSGAQGSTVSLFYGQSYSLVAFLVETYGEERFAELFRVFREGATTAGALEQVYGFNQDGLENAWRASVGLPPREAPTPGDGQAIATPEPTATPSPASESGGDGGPPIAVIVIIATLTVLLAGALLGAGVLVARR